MKVIKKSENKVKAHCLIDGFLTRCQEGADLRTSDEKAKHIGDSRDSKCCNIKRGNDFVPPFIFSESMCKEFEYRNNGLLIWNDASPKEAERKRKVVADTLGLNCEELRTIRRIWFFLASNHYACNGISQEEKEAILLCIAAFAKPTERDSIYKFQNPKYWDLLEEYDFFNDTSKFTI